MVDLIKPRFKRGLVFPSPRTASGALDKHPDPDAQGGGIESGMQANTPFDLRFLLWGFYPPVVGEGVATGNGVRVTVGVEG